MKEAFGIIDLQKGFIPVEETFMINKDGYGELGVKGGGRLVHGINRLIGIYALTRHFNNNAVFTTQDWHPEDTAHFSENPDFVTTWPRHCVANTAGASLDPCLNDDDTETFIKGFEPLINGEDDDSYSGYNAVRYHDRQTMPDWLKSNDIDVVTLSGLALDYCVGETALDIKQKLGIRVRVLMDLTEGISDDGIADMKSKFKTAGVEMITSRQIEDEAKQLLGDQIWHAMMER